MYSIQSLSMLAIILAAANAVTASDDSKDGLTIKSEFDETNCVNRRNSDTWDYPSNILHVDWSLFAENDESKRWDLTIKSINNDGNDGPEQVNTLIEEKLWPGVFKFDLDFGKDGDRKAYISGGDSNGLDLPDHLVGFDFTVADPDNQDKNVNLRVETFICPKPDWAERRKARLRR